MSDTLNFRQPTPAYAAYAPDDGAAIGLDPAARERLGPTLTENLDAAALAEVLEELDTGVLVCTEQGHVMLANDAGRRELQCGRPLSLDATGALQIADDDGSTTAQCRMALRAAVRTQRRQLLALGEGAHRLMVAVTPLGRSSRPWALVLLGRRRPAPELAIEMLGQLCDLTSSEHSVLVALLAGERVGGVARRRGVKIATVRTQVCALRAKLGAQRIEDLVRLAAGLPPMISALRAPSLPGSARPRLAAATATAAA